MKRSVFLWLVVLGMTALSGRAADSKLYAQWPLANSLFMSTGAVSLHPYGGGVKLSDSAAVFEDGAVGLGDITLFGTPMLDVAEGITVTGWIKPKEIEEGFSKTAPHTLIYFYDSKDRGKTQFIFRILDGKLNAFNADPAKNIFSSFAATEDEWSFFAFVLKSDAVDIYMNQYPPQTTAISNSYQYDRIYVGALNTDLARAYRGLMKNLRLYKEALGPKEIQAIYKSEK